MTLTEDDLKQVEALIRKRVRESFVELAKAADWYTNGYDDATHSVAYVLKDAAERVFQGMDPDPEPESESCTQHEYRYFGPHSGSRCVSCNKPVPGQTEPEPVNPFTPKRTPKEWADAIKALIAEAGADGSELWVDVEHYAGPGPYVRIGPPDSTGRTDPIIWGMT